MINNPEFNQEGIMKWERVIPSLYWKEVNNFIVADRHLPDGKRQHMVKGHIKENTEVSNADVIGEDDVPNAEYASHLSHLSK